MNAFTLVIGDGVGHPGLVGHPLSYGFPPIGNPFLFEIPLDAGQEVIG